MFHEASERLIRPLDRADNKTLLGALQRTFNEYDNSVSKGHARVTPKYLAQAWGKGYGDISEVRSMPISLILSICVSVSHFLTPTHSLSLVLVVMIKPKELKTKISLTRSLILSHFSIS